MSERAKWETRYTNRAGTAIDPPSSFLTEHRALLPAGRALDVASGDGRNALWLAREGFAVDAIDRAHAGLARMAAIARCEGLVVRGVQADLEHFALPSARYAVVVNSRYLQRSLFDGLRRAVQPGGVIVFETFLREQARLGHPRNPAFLLEPGELRAEFAAFEPLVDEEGCFERDGGRVYLARLIARRPVAEGLD
ncbi:MAG TPA: methyltransferase domain-containing protein [Candidatus Dormibacteraeota bacterium]|nr:methyltransferase domain-containing protein [Candidatus Dormibacteraeota bacterium]